jgi:hypothetical protein
LFHPPALIGSDWAKQGSHGVRRHRRFSLLHFLVRSLGPDFADMQYSPQQ